MEKPDKKKQIISFLKGDFLIIILDIIAVNAAYYLALVIRFFVGGKFYNTLSMLPSIYSKFAPFYKRMCEMIVQSRKGDKTSFSATRFGNVLGSNGSVIPLFRRQIANGGPVTVTDKRITRFFMTIPEASQLVMTSGAMAKNGELYVLDMGKPVKIYDLAEKMIRLSGLEPYKDIDIVETGLRPGEKLYEELLIRTEEMDKTENDLIFIERTGHTYQKKHQEAADDILRQLRKWRNA